MTKFSKNRTLVTIVSVVLIVATVFFASAFGGGPLATILDYVRPSTSEFAIWKIVPLTAFGIGFAFLAERFYFKSFAELTGLFLAVWFALAWFVNRSFSVDLLFPQVFLISIVLLLAVQIKRLWRLDSRLSSKLIGLTSSGHLMEGKNPDARVDSGLQLLQTVLPLSEAIVFQYEENGELNPVGRSRKGNERETLTARQTSWRSNVALCERALSSRQTVVETEGSPKGAAKIALPLITENELVGGLFVDIKEKFERNDQHLLEAFSEQLARNFQRKQLRSKGFAGTSWWRFLSSQTQESRINMANLINGLIKEQSFGVVATSYIKEAHAIAYLDGTIAYVNRQMRESALLKPGEINEINMFDLLARFKTGVFSDPSIAVRRVLQTGQTFQSELVFPETETTLDLEISLVKIASDIENVYDTEVPKKPACFLITLRDITTLKENEKLRSDTVNLISHELRTPITSIQGFAEMLKIDEGIPEDAREYLSIIANESQRASKLLSTFLSVANLQQADKQEFHKSPVHVDRVVEEVVENMKETAKKKRIRLAIKQNGEVPAIAADRGLLTKAIHHLVDNAVKYSPERSSVIISTQVESDFLNIVVEDRGFGIAPADQEKIWNKFYRVARDGKDKQEESTGLGLALVKEIVEQHAGSVAVKSEVGRGSTFRIKIPRL